MVSLTVTPSFARSFIGFANATKQRPIYSSYSLRSGREEVAGATSQLRHLTYPHNGDNKDNGGERGAGNGLSLL
ncbi:hypothetical protein J6590_058622 [Homalodisca vitripennis]|nr:hypothetical protein J6590_058622 [Homalodisca vitripennis]